MSSVVRVQEERLDGTAIATLEGELDASSVSDVALRLRRIVETWSLRLVVDLTEVVYLDSAGINLLYAVGSELRARQQELHLVVVPGSPIERTLAIVGANRAFPVHANRDEALAT
jgi:anti-sigma B factor antagonist